MVATIEIIVILVVAFVPALLYVLWFRNAEIHQREPFTSLIGSFIFGATISVILAIFLEFIAGIPVSILVADVVTISLILAIVIAPLVEEFTKALGILTKKRRLTEPENGFVYGAAVGLGFAASENVLYFLTAYSQGTDVFIILAVVRTLTSTLLHASATALVGFGIARSLCMINWFGTPKSWIPYYIAAVIIHALFNILASLSELTGSDSLTIIGLIFAFALVIGIVFYVRSRIKQLDRTNREGEIRCQ